MQREFMGRDYARAEKLHMEERIMHRRPMQLCNRIYANDFRNPLLGVSNRKSYVRIWVLREFRKKLEDRISLR